MFENAPVVNFIKKQQNCRIVGVWKRITVVWWYWGGHVNR